MTRVAGDPADVAARLPELTAQIDPGWIASGSTTPHGWAMTRRWLAGSAEAVIADDQWVDRSLRSLREWHALRPGKLTMESYRTVLGQLRPLLAPLEQVSFDQSIRELRVTALSPREHMAEILAAFEIAGQIKPKGSKWMAASKLLYLLLPDLVVPMDNSYTAPFFGLANLRFPLSHSFLQRAYDAFEQIAQSQRCSLAEQAAAFSPQLGLARVIDFGIVGYVCQSRPGTP